jgi:two-component system cell cycle response regulator
MAKVLIVDDNESFRRLNAEFIKMDGHEVLTARNGRETLDLVRREHPDILLLDIMMPGIDGYEICRKIKSDKSTQDTTVVMVTALPPNERFKSFQAGADEHITKPIQSRQLRDLIRRLVARKEQGDNE